MIAALALAGALMANQQVQAQSVISHWSFDTPTLTSDGSGNITGAANSTGNHDAFVDTTTGVGTANSGVNPSGTFAASDSVSGAFGQGIMFNGNNYLEYPELTELAGPNVSFSISFWLLLPASVSSPSSYWTMSDWGNGASSGSNAKYVYDFGPNGATGTRFQFRTGTGNGTDLFHHEDRTVSTVNDGNWHMYTWVYNAPPAGSSNCEILTYFDGTQIGDKTTATISSDGMAVAASLYGTFGFKGDSGSFIPSGSKIDEAWVFDGTLSQNQVTGLYSANDINTVPEPGAMAFAGLGVSLLIGLRRFRRRA